MNQTSNNVAKHRYVLYECIDYGYPRTRIHKPMKLATSEYIGRVHGEWWFVTSIVANEKAVGGDDGSAHAGVCM